MNGRPDKSEDAKDACLVYSPDSLKNALPAPSRHTINNTKAQVIENNALYYPAHSVCSDVGVVVPPMHAGLPVIQAGNSPY